MVGRYSFYNHQDVEIIIKDSELDLLNQKMFKVFQKIK